MQLHIIIPVLNEEENLRRLLPYLCGELAGRGSITVADGGSDDGTRELCSAVPGVTYLACAERGRSRQMNEAAASLPEGPGVRYFVHADTRPPTGFYGDIRAAIGAGYAAGCYRFRFDSSHPLLAVNAFCTRFSGLACRGGDQSLWLTGAAWEKLGGFDGTMSIMEDYDIIERIWASGLPFRVIPRAITVSARKYATNGWVRVQLANLKVFRMYRRGAPQGQMVAEYRRRLRAY